MCDQDAPEAAAVLRFGLQSLWFVAERRLRTRLLFITLASGERLSVSEGNSSSFFTAAVCCCTLLEGICLWVKVHPGLVFFLPTLW